VGEAIDIPRAEDEAAAKLKWIQPKFVLTMAGGAGAIAALEIITVPKASRVEDPSNIRSGAGTGSRMLKENGLVPANAQASRILSPA
jgi:hypothetical protein